MALTRSAEQLIARHIDSVGALDLLLLVHEHRDRDWSPDELSEVLRCPDGWIAEQVARLKTLDLLHDVAPARWRYRHGQRFGAAVDELSRACRSDRAAVTRKIFARPPRSQLARP